MPEPPREQPGLLRPQRVPAQQVARLVERLGGARLHGDPAVAVTGITHDSRLVQRGDLYLARAGAQVHGIRFVADALTAGAAAVLTDAESVGPAVAAGSAAVVEVPDPRAATGPAAAWVYGDPSQDLLVIGVTGTNGKTTTAYLVDAGLRAAGRRTGLVGTIETLVAGRSMPSLRTTPEATDLQALFAVMREQSVTDVAMEVSSHALALDRVEGTVFAVAGFTNLSQDHLDFHADMEEYFQAKRRLFVEGSPPAAVNVGDEYGRRLAAELPEALTFGFAADAVVGPAALDGVDLKLRGRFNAENALGAVAAARLLGIDEAAIVRGLESVRGVPGRFESIDEGQPFDVVVDYAHKPLALETLLLAVRELATGRVICVFGCGGDRDREKRPQMGRIASELADVVIVTNDNPRSEDPQSIIDAILAGTVGEVEVEPDRARAIEQAIETAREGDVVLIAGKGAEQGQEFADRVIPFDDREAAREALRTLGART
jgi:UDP-N-acetylmuramoyl-L-alanyl-D-glutamate--2,6-diaminopimelate ligase